MDFGTFKSVVRRLMDDASAIVAYEDTDILDGLVSGLHAIIHWLPNEAVIDLDDPDGETLSWIIENAYMITGVYDNSAKVFLERATLEPGVRRSQYTELDWVDYPPGNILFDAAPATGANLTVYYRAYFDEPENEDDNAYEIPVPRAAMRGLMFYTAFAMLTREVLRTARTRRFGDRQQDAGDPEDNPMQRAQRHFLDLFHVEMERLPVLHGRG